MSSRVPHCDSAVDAAQGKFSRPVTNHEVAGGRPLPVPAPFPADGLRVTAAGMKMATRPGVAMLAGA